MNTLTAPGRGTILVVVAATLALGVAAAWRILAESLNPVTGYLFLGAACAAAWLVAEGLIALSPAARRHTPELRLLVGTSTLLLFGLETGLRIWAHELRTYFERNGNPEYVSHYDQVKPSWFLVHPPDYHMEWSSNEFTHVRETNSLGLSEVELDSTKAPEEFRIITLGDSFTEGVGTTYDSSWVRVAERVLQAEVPDRTIRVYNAGVSGSDVFYEYILLRERLLAFEPDLVVVTTNSTDVSDVIIRGGFERFHPDGTLRAPRGPGWEWFFAISFIGRAVIYGLLDYNWLLIPERRMTERSREAVQDIHAAIDSIQAMGERHGFEVFVVVHPGMWEARNGEWAWGYDELLADLAATPPPPAFDVMGHFQANQIMTPETAARYYWPLDSHFTAEGYRLMGVAVAGAIRQAFF